MSGVQHYRIDVFRSCAKGVSLDGVIPLGQFARLADALVDSQGVVTFSIRLYEEGAERYRVVGWVDTELMLTCQRCLQPVSIKVNSELRLGLVQSEQEAELLDASWDPQLIETAILDMAEVIEDELLLSVPAFPLHPTVADCEALGWQPWKAEQDVDQADSEAQEEKENPFAILEQLKKH